MPRVATPSTPALMLLPLLGLALSVGACNRLADSDFEGFGDIGAEEEGEGLEGENPGSGGEISESCWDGIPQPGEYCQVQAPDLDSGIDPCSLSVADFDDDGRPDLAVPNSNWLLPPGSAHVNNVLRGYGNGDFAPTQAYDAGAELPVGLAAGDFDGDGDLDIATANNEANAAFLSFNEGGMDFGQASQTSVGAVASSISAGDIDNDGVDDLVVTTPSGVALIQNGPGGAEWMTTLDVGGAAMHAELVDMDHDGRLDMLVAVMDSFGDDDYVRIYHGFGDGSFPEWVDHPLSGNPWWVVPGDLNMDGDLDLVTADYGSNVVSILLGNGQGGFSERTEIDVCAGPQSVAVGDMNNDGANDIVVGCMDGDEVQMWLQIEGGEFELTRWWATGLQPVSVQLADLNLDGALDVAWANQYSNTVGMALSHP
ncbi:Integrins alpha chain [Plesiocystis pacifica SIR-1]|uniref:Integrins alpha chain n=1 Tax=Plesiocystis pacifica SIR-1 TaxID=391625 RepID=A6GCX9_9BACT|nr:VCBS repeat-containing protein [Plesiocystis pacifica]EDM76303.1 Integrins alpha chain [Plesiocystis pacifica SIR-1]